VDGQLIETFDNIPDAPIASFDLTINGGKGSILVLADDLCTVTPTAEVQADGQNGKVADGSLVASTPCTLRALKRKATHRRLKLRLGGLGPGKVIIDGSMVHRSSRVLKAASVATVRTKLSLKAQRLARQHRLRRLGVRVTFQPADGSAARGKTYHVRVKQ
ncbi:MAG TPA: hypothetical protein VFT50_18670, partial [Baekduia sp.]|nr:hypothetical protein [Baekduia sp.]